MLETIILMIMLYAINVAIRRMADIIEENRFWSFIEKHGVSLTYAYPFAIVGVGIELYVGESILGAYWATWIIDVLLISVIINDSLALNDVLALRARYVSDLAI